jgi:autotransporter-associated beta strand protein
MEEAFVEIFFNREISGSGGLFKDNANTTALLTSNNSDSGATTLASGRLQLGNGGITGTAGSGAVHLSGGTLDP